MDTVSLSAKIAVPKVVLTIEGSVVACTLSAADARVETTPEEEASAVRVRIDPTSSASRSAAAVFLFLKAPLSLSPEVGEAASSGRRLNASFASV